MTGKKQLIYGKHPVLEAIAAGKKFERVFVRQGIEASMLQALREQAIRYQVVPPEKLNRLTRKNHQGIVALLQLIDYHSIENLLPFIFEQGEVPLLLMLDGVTDVRNFGSVARTASGAGVHGIIIPEKGGAAVNADAISASAGTLMKMPVCREKDLAACTKFIRKSGVKLIAASSSGNKKVFECDLTVPAAVILGAEDVGISHTLLREADEIASLPMPGKIDSYNVSVSAGMILYEVMRQRRSVNGDR